MVLKITFVKTFMKKTILLSVFAFLFATITAQAQWNSNDLRDKAGRLVSSSSELASRMSDDLRRGSSKSRSDIDAAFLASQIESSARLFEQMVRDNRRESEVARCRFDSFRFDAACAELRLTKLLLERFETKF